MKFKIALIGFLISISYSEFAQGEAKSVLIVADYPKEISCEIGFTADIPIPFVTTTCKGELHITQNDELASGGCRGTLIRYYTFVDDCGSKTEATQFVKLKDTEPPQLFDVPKEVFLLGKELIPASAIVSATDNSGDAISVFMMQEEKDLLIIRTWSAEDVCGNRTEAVQKIHISH